MVRRIIHLIRKGKVLSNQQLARIGRQVGSRHPYLASLYIGLTGRFAHECYTVLNGQRRHLAHTGLDGAMFTLRRNTHRLEKGLIMRPRFDVFAESYIEETLDAFEKLHRECSDQAHHKPLLRWSTDVMCEYFRVTGNSDVLDRARARYEGLVNEAGLKPGKTIPYKRVLDPQLPSLEQMLDLARHRRSVRWYLPQPVPREMIDKAIDVARYSPSACNRQPFEFRVFDSRGWIDKIGALPLGVRGFVENFPCLIVVVGRQRAYFDDRDRHVIYIDGSLATMSLVFALEVQGLSSCCINWPAINARDLQMARLIGLEADEVPIMLVSVGFPDPEGMVPSSEKKPVEELRRYNE